jgi:uncharacterized membrane protein YqgA involved in biofilm formation
MFGVLVNALSIVAGSLVGVVVKKGIKDRYTQTIIQGLGLAVVALGIMGSLEANNMLIVIVSIAIGSIIGEWIDIEKLLENIGDKIQSRFSKSEGEDKSSIAKAFVAATLMYCSGGMAIVGSLQSGLEQNYTTLFIKSILDGVTSIVLASAMGVGVIFSAVSVFLYQGLIAISASFAKGLLTDVVVADMSSIGGILILGIGINILGLSKIKVGNMIPAVIIPIIYYSIFS